MRLREFIRRNRKTIDQYIARRLGMDHNPIANDTERKAWVLSDEDLYIWARSVGVPI